MRNPRALTLNEVADLVGRLSGRPCSPRQVRYLLIQGGLASDASPHARGATRLFGPIDVAVMRLAVAMRDEGVSPNVVRLALTYRRAEVVRAWKAAANLALGVRGVEASLESASQPRPSRVTAWVPLRPIWRNLEGEIQKVCDARDTVWMYRRVLAPSVPGPTGR